ncbi:GNAT family N-acetyltransferase [Candidatus Poriferisodalis sp.]|uniref:GNAT family N-acetyltransferase n=1 Tax=Candidatus Poriferisodalis sp. TaxID=3101277 RepID=UPI003B5A851F
MNVWGERLPRSATALGRLVIDLGHQGEGLAAALLKHFLLTALEVAELTGLRLVLVHAKDDQASGFYRHFGFEPSPIDDLTLMLVIKDIRSQGGLAGTR